MNVVQSQTIFTSKSLKVVSGIVKTEFYEFSRNKTVTRTETCCRIESENNRFTDTRNAKTKFRK